MDLPRHPVVHGHPIHAILSDGPIVLIPLSAAAELWDRRRGGEGIRLGDVVTAAAASAASCSASSADSCAGRWAVLAAPRGTLREPPARPEPASPRPAAPYVCQ